MYFKKRTFFASEAIFIAFEFPLTTGALEMADEEAIAASVGKGFREISVNAELVGFVSIFDVLLAIEVNWAMVVAATDSTNGSVGSCLISDSFIADGLKKNSYRYAKAPRNV